MAEFVTQRDIPTSQRAQTTFELSGMLKTVVDQLDPNAIYVGWANPGIATTAAAWRIKKLTTASSVTTTTYANGHPGAFNAVWDDRASLSYA